STAAARLRISASRELSSAARAGDATTKALSATKRASESVPILSPRRKPARLTAAGASFPSRATEADGSFLRKAPITLSLKAFIAGFLDKVVSWLRKRHVRWGQYHG